MQNFTIEEIKNNIRDIPDFPKQGIIFKDITPLLKDSGLFASIIEHFRKELEGKQIDYIIGIESRGFIFGCALANSLGCGFIPIRKPGKLPFKTRSATYSLEYGEDTLEIHEDAVGKGDKVVIIDDLLATGGTAVAALGLVESLGADVEALMFLIELGFLKGREKLSSCKNVVSLINF